MDQELRTAIRALQRADKSLSELNLHELLDDKGLADLIHHCIIARLKLIGVTFFVGSAKDRADGRIYTPDNDATAGPRVFYARRTSLGTHQLPKVVRGENALEVLPVGVTQRIQAEWNPHVLSTEPRTYLYGPPNRANQAVFKRLGIFALPYPVRHPENCFEFHLGDVWKETQEAYEQFKNKKLREMGLIPGRNG